jgi:hypothetical protein
MQHGYNEIRAETEYDMVAQNKMHISTEMLTTTITTTHFQTLPDILTSHHSEQCLCWRD